MPLGAAIEARCGAPYWTVRRAHLHGALLDAAAGVPAISLSYGAEVLGVHADAADDMTVSSADGRDRHAAALIAADGVWSRLRTVVADGPEPKGSGYTAYRAIVPADVAGGSMWLSSGRGCRAIRT